MSHTACWILHRGCRGAMCRQIKGKQHLLSLISYAKPWPPRPLAQRDGAVLRSPKGAQYSPSYHCAGSRGWGQRLARAMAARCLALLVMCVRICSQRSMWKGKAEQRVAKCTSRASPPHSNDFVFASIFQNLLTGALLTLCYNLWSHRWLERVIHFVDGKCKSCCSSHGTVQPATKDTSLTVPSYTRRGVEYPFGSAAAISSDTNNTALTNNSSLVSGSTLSQSPGIWGWAQPKAGWVQPEVWGSLHLKHIMWLCTFQAPPPAFSADFKLYHGVELILALFLHSGRGAGFGISEPVKRWTGDKCCIAFLGWNLAETQPHSPFFLFVVICCFEAAEETKEFWESLWKHCSSSGPRWMHRAAPGPSWAQGSAQQMHWSRWCLRVVVSPQGPNLQLQHCERICLQ